ncbi:MAG: hypothetical protein DSZ21_00680 [Tenericutes bacterium]|nr:MAG: hypothetical protein DSZ21_00680 [Mycoplasmatota bacterium]
MRFLGIVGFFFLIFADMGFAQSLPQWSESDLLLLEKGELVVGASLLVDDIKRPPRAMVVDENEKDESKSLTSEEDDLQADGDYDPVEIPKEYLRDYFDQKPDSYLVDPQRLFTNQETLDLEGFLTYCADESDVDIRVYLFGAHQKLPDGYSLKRLVEEQYADGTLTAVVFYFLGNPKRNQIQFGGKDSQIVNAEKLRKMLDLAQVKALEKTDPVAQVESFVVQLSISIYWIEQELKELQARLQDQEENPMVEKKAVSQPKKEKFNLMEVVQPYLLPTFLVLLAVGSLIATLIWWRRSRRYYFPVLNVPHRLGGEHAAGIGAVMRFYDKTESPNRQHREISDYLTRI